MNVLILSCHTGKGHDSAAAAVAEEVSRRGCGCTCVDALELISSRTSRMVCGGHVWLYRHAPRLFDWGYRRALIHPEAVLPGRLSQRKLTIAAKRLETVLRNGGYDRVLCTHVFAGLLMKELRGVYPGKTYFLATDYGCSPGVGLLDADFWLIPDLDLAEEFCACGVPQDKLIPTGIPVREKLLSSMPAEEAKIREGIDAAHRHLVMMCGSMGCGPMESVTRELARVMERDMELTVVCGSNETLRRKLLRLYAANPSVHIRGYVEDISRLMDSADVILTKPGGISATECGAKSLPMVFIHAVAGCETHNLRYFQKMGGAVTADTPRKLAEISCALLKDAARRKTLAEILSAKDFGAASRKVAELISGSDITDIRNRE